MIKYTVVVSFPMGIRFNNNPKLLFYRKMFNMIKKVSCLNNECKCINCPFNANCIYYRISGKNFREYPAIIVDTKIFEKNFYDINQQLKMDFYLLGNMTTYINFIQLFFTNFLNQRICGKPFYLIKQSQEIIDIKEIVSFKNMKIKTIVEGTDICKIVNDQISYYRDNYDVCLDMGEKNISLVKMNEVCIQSDMQRIKGYIGEIIFSENNVISNSLVKIGVGKYCYMGGGKIEIND